MDLLIEMKELRFSLELEPLFCTLSIFDIEKRVRVSLSSFLFDITEFDLMETKGNGEFSFPAQQSTCCGLSGGRKDTWLPKHIEKMSSTCPQQPEGNHHLENVLFLNLLFFSYVSASFSVSAYVSASLPFS